tara:strand:+ start:2663 stop:3514 length:852 start_codon:yes stop_codon:yes gene_type:complete
MIKINIVKLPPEAYELASKIEDKLANMTARAIKSVVGVDNNLENFHITVSEGLKQLILQETTKAIQQVKKNGAKKFANMRDPVHRVKEFKKYGGTAKKIAQILAKNKDLIKKIEKNHKDILNQNLDYKKFQDFAVEAGLELPDLPLGANLHFSKGNYTKPIVTLSGGDQIGPLKYYGNIRLQGKGVKKASGGIKYTNTDSGFGANLSADFKGLNEPSWKANLNKKIGKNLDFYASGGGDKRSYSAGVGLRGTFEESKDKNNILTENIKKKINNFILKLIDEQF